MMCNYFLFVVILCVKETHTAYIDTDFFSSDTQ